MENNLNRDPNFDKADKDPRQGNPQKDQKQQMEKNQEERKNKNWDQVQRREQAAPRSYNTSTDEENIGNQNTLADQEQTDRPESVDPEDYQNKNKSQGNFLVGDRATERQQTRDDEEDMPNSGASKDRRVD